MVSWTSSTHGVGDGSGNGDDDDDDDDDVDDAGELKEAVQ